MGLIGVGLLFTNADHPETQSETESSLDEQPVDQNKEFMRILSWNLKRKSQRALDIDRVAGLGVMADIIVLQGLDPEEKGKGTLHVVADLIQGRDGDKICRAWFRNQSDRREPYGVLWRSSVLDVVDPTGEVKDGCGEMAVILPSPGKKNERVLVSSIFLYKPQRRLFHVAMVHWDNRPKRPERDINHVARALPTGQFPVIMASNFHLASKNTVFSELKKLKFNPVVKGRSSKPSFDNLWVRNAVVAKAVTLNLYEKFSELSRKDVDTSLAEQFPLFAEVALVPKADEALQMIMVQKSKKDQATALAEKKEREAAKGKVVSEAPAPPFEEPVEDLEQEEVDADEEHRGPASRNKAKAPVKKKKSKKN